MRVTLDRSADAAYIYFTVDEPDVAKTLPISPHKACGHMVNLDFDRTGRLIGIELLDASKGLPLELLDKAEIIG